MTGKKEILLAVFIPVITCAALAVAWRLYVNHKNAIFESKFESVSSCRQYQQCVEALGPESYCFKLDDEDEADLLNRRFGEKAWPPTKNANVAFWLVESIPPKPIYVIYDRTTGAILEVGWVHT